MATPSSLSTIPFRLGIESRLHNKSLEGALGQLAITGEMSLDHLTVVNTGLSISARISGILNWKQAVPIFKPNVDWLRRETDWHCSPEGELCVLLGCEWVDGIKEHLKMHSEVATAEWAATWYMDSAASLTYRHYLGYKYNITKWPQAWTAYGHGWDGIEEYMAQEKSRQPSAK
jgi:hypothetical protein